MLTNVELDLNGLEIVSPEECVRLLRTRSLGRIGLSAEALPVILPVNYVLKDDMVVIRTRRGTKLARATRNSIVAFEVDEIDQATGSGWSVMIQGLAREASAQTAHAMATEPALARWLDPVTSKHFSISIDRMSGRRLHSATIADRHAADGSTTLW